MEAAPIVADWVTESQLVQNWRASTTRRLERSENNFIPQLILTLTYVLMKIFSGGKAGLFGWCYGRLLKSSTNPILQPSVAMHFPCVQSVWNKIFLSLKSVFAEMLVLCPSNCMQRLLPRFSPAYILSSSFSSTNPSIEDHHEFTVPSFGGKLEVNSRIPVEVVPSCPQTFPNMDRAFIKVLRSPGL